MSTIWPKSACTAAGVTCKDDGVEAGLAPQLHEVNHVPEAQRRVTSEHDARLTELTAEVSVDAGVVLQLVGLDQLQAKQQRRNPLRRSRHHLNVHEGSFFTTALFVNMAVCAVNSLFIYIYIYKSCLLLYTLTVLHIKCPLSRFI